MCMMLLAATLTFTACGDDDDDNGGGNNNQQQQQQGEVNQDNYYKYSESVNVPALGGTFTVIGEATFDKGKCTAMAFSYVYPKSSTASAIYKQYQKDEDAADYSYDGKNTVVWTVPQEDVAGIAQLGKENVCAWVKQIVQSTIEEVTNVVNK